MSKKELRSSEKPLQGAILRMGAAERHQDSLPLGAAERK